MKGKLNHGILAVGSAILLLGAGATAHAETLGGAVAKALASHPRTKAAQASSEASYYEAMERQGERLPQLGISGTFGPNFRDRNVEGLATGDWLAQRELRATLTQAIYQGGLLKNNQLAAEKRAEAAKVLEEDVDEELALLVAEAYTGVLRAQEQIRLAEANVAVHEDTAKSSQERFDGGRGTTADVELVNARLRLAKASVETRKALLESAQVRYRELVGEDPVNLQPVGNIGVDIPSTVSGADLSENPAVRAAYLIHQAAEYEAQASRGLSMPRLDLETSGGIGEDAGGVKGEDNEFHAFLVGSMPLYSGGTLKATRNRFDARAREAAELAENTKRLANDAVGTAIADRKGAIRSQRELKEYSGSMKKVVDAYVQQLEIGSRAILNVLDVKNEDYRADSSVVDSEYARIMADLRVLATMGRLVDTLAPGARASSDGDGKTTLGDDQTIHVTDPGTKLIAAIGPNDNANEAAAAPEKTEEPSASPFAEESAPAEQKPSILARLFGTRPSADSSGEETVEEAAPAAEVAAAPVAEVAEPADAETDAPAAAKPQPFAGLKALFAKKDDSAESGTEKIESESAPAPAAKPVAVAKPAVVAEATEAPAESEPEAAAPTAKPFGGLSRLFSRKSSEQAPAAEEPATESEAPAAATTPVPPVAQAPSSEQPVIYQSWADVPGR